MSSSRLIYFLMSTYLTSAFLTTSLMSLACFTESLDTFLNTFEHDSTTKRMVFMIRSMVSCIHLISASIASILASILGAGSIIVDDNFNRGLAMWDRKISHSLRPMSAIILLFLGSLLVAQIKNRRYPSADVYNYLCFLESSQQFSQIDRLDGDYWFLVDVL